MSRKVSWGFVGLRQRVATEINGRALSLVSIFLFLPVSSLPFSVSHPCSFSLCLMFFSRSFSLSFQCLGIFRYTSAVFRFCSIPWCLLEEGGANDAGTYHSALELGLTVDDKRYLLEQHQRYPRFSSRNMPSEVRNYVKLTGLALNTSFFLLDNIKESLVDRVLLSFDHVEADGESDPRDRCFNEEDVDGDAQYRRPNEEYEDVDAQYRRLKEEGVEGNAQGRRLQLDSIGGGASGIDGGRHRARQPQLLGEGTTCNFGAMFELVDVELNIRDVVSSLEPCLCRAVMLITIAAPLASVIPGYAALLLFVSSFPPNVECVTDCRCI